MELKKEQIEELKRLAEKATPGNWHTPGICEVHAADHSIVAETFGFNDPEDDLPKGQHEANADFIAAANPQTILSIISLAQSALTYQSQEQLKLEKLRDLKDPQTVYVNMLYVCPWPSGYLLNQRMFEVDEHDSSRR